MILLLLKGQAHFEEHAARIIKRMVNGWNCTATDILIEKHLNEYKHLDPKIRTQIFMLFNKMKYKKEADLDGGEDLMYLRDNLNKLSRPARSKNT